MDITAVVVLNETPPVTAAVAVDETTLQATVNPSPGEAGGGGGGGSGGAASKSVRIDSTSAANTIYVGKAATGTAESAAGWTITREVFTTTGVRLPPTKAASGAWTNRTSLTYS
jgi:hypothetical protein